MKRQKITLKVGEEIQVNGYIIRAIGAPLGSPASQANQLQIHHTNFNVVPEYRRNHAFDVWAGYGHDGNNLAVSSTLCLGTVGDLLNAPGATEATQERMAAHLAAMKRLCPDHTW